MPYTAEQANYLSSIENIFFIFPPTTKSPFSNESLVDVQINLHAFVINLSGIFDNWAWAYVLRHDLKGKNGKNANVGMFLKATRQHLPAVLRESLSSKNSVNWHDLDLKSFRDALAHRIPPYPP